MRIPLISLSSNVVGNAYRKANAFSWTTASVGKTEDADAVLLRSRSQMGFNTSRRIHVNVNLPAHLVDHHGQPKHHFKSNKIRTSKYTLLTFLPKNLYEQFHRLANVYFLFMVILQLIPTFSVGNEVFVFLPLLTVLAFTAIKDAFEDRKRHQVDHTLNISKTRTLKHWHNVNRRYVSTTTNNDNNSWFHSVFNWCRSFTHLRKKNKSISFEKHPCHPASPSAEINVPEFNSTLWKDVSVGDIIMLRKDEPVPADILLLSTSDSNNECYVETKNLDGETNLKARSALDELSYIRNPIHCASLKAIIDTDAPSSNLFACQGSITLSGSADSSGSSEPTQIVPFNIKNIVLRGHVLKNTHLIYGLVLFTGQDTKIMMNSGNTPSKRSRIEQMMNKQVLINFLILIILGICLAIGYGITCSQWHGTPVALLFGIQDQSSFLNGFINFWAALILLQNVIPVSLFVTIEFVKSFQAYFIYNDIKMYYEPTNTPCIPKSWNLSDDLGQVEYIFSDKTGTLTRNIMEFIKCSINGKVYGQTLPQLEDLTDETEVAKTEKEEAETTAKQLLLKEYFDARSQLFEPVYSRKENEKYTFIDPEIYRDLAKLNTKQSEMIFLFMMNLALCHTELLEQTTYDNDTDNIDAETTLNGNENENELSELIYRAESPDEKALVEEARKLGFVYMGRELNSVRVDFLGVEYVFEQLELIEFNSDRKRMSVVCKRPSPWNDVILLCKGADNVILELLAKEQDELIASTHRQLNQFSVIGLRTLCLAYRILSVEEFFEWRKQYRLAQADLANRESKMSALESQMERELILLGATAIEDKLQEQVPECIESLRMAGIKVWVLTGDKMETAINIGFGCKLLTKEMSMWVLNPGTPLEVQTNFRHIIQQVKSFPDSKDKEKQGCALVIDGNALTKLFQETSLVKELVEIAPYINSVICCRTSPLQKAQVVHMIRKGHQAMTLSIGDGANDVSMIQTAHIGVAIAGEEGLQASMASDYTIGQFRYLKNLLLVHGQLSYHRIAEMVLCFFYKNIFWTLSGFWYQFYCGYSSNLFYEYSFIQLFNLIFTVAPIAVLGSMDQRLNYEHAMNYPQAYQHGIKGRFFNYKIFWLYIIEGIWQSLVCYFTYYFIYHEEVVNGQGNSGNVYYISTSVAIVVVIMVNLFISFHTRYWTRLSYTTLAFSLVFLLVFVPVYSLLVSTDYYSTSAELFARIALFWLGIPLSIVICGLPRFLVVYIKNVFRPHDLTIIREMQLCKKSTFS